MEENLHTTEILCISTAIMKGSSEQQQQQKKAKVELPDDPTIILLSVLETSVLL